MQELEIGKYDIRQSDEGEIAIIIPNVNDLEYIQSIDLVVVDVENDKLEIIYSYDDVVDRKLSLRDVSVATRFMIKGAEDINIIELMSEDTMLYKATHVIT